MHETTFQGVCRAEGYGMYTAARLFDDATKTWWDGPSAVVDEYLRERAAKA